MAGTTVPRRCTAWRWRACTGSSAWCSIPMPPSRPSGCRRPDALWPYKPVAVVDLARKEYPMLELRPTCEHCNKALPPDSLEARICSYECTFCVTCVNEVLRDVCPNCGGGFVPRPIRPARNWKGDNFLGKDPASTKVRHRPVDPVVPARFTAEPESVPPEKRYPAPPAFQRVQRSEHVPAERTFPGLERHRASAERGAQWNRVRRTGFLPQPVIVQERKPDGSEVVR